MKHALLIFNGIKFSHELADKAVAWAKKHSGSIHVLFLASHETEEQYAFPSDLDQAQDVTDKNDADQSDMQVVESQAKLLENMAASENVPCQTEIMVEPALDDVLSKTRDAAIILIAAGDGEPGLMSVTKFEIKELIDQLPANVEKLIA